MAGTSQAMQQPQSRCGMGMAPVVALTAHMQMQMLVGLVAIVMVFMAVQLQPKGRSHCQSTHHQQSNAHQKFRPGGHRFDVDQILKPD